MCVSVLQLVRLQLVTTVDGCGLHAFVFQDLVWTEQ